SATALCPRVSRSPPGEAAAGENRLLRADNFEFHPGSDLKIERAGVPIRQGVLTGAGIAALATCCRKGAPRPEGAEGRVQPRALIPASLLKIYSFRGRASPN